MLLLKQSFCGLFVSFFLIGLYHPASAQTDRCEEGWVYFNEVNGFTSDGMCYLPIGESLTAPEAKTFCEDRVSYLLSLDRIDQFYLQPDKSNRLPNFLFNNFTEEFWSGMSVSPESGRLVWHQFGPKFVELSRFGTRPWSLKSGVPNVDNTCGKVRLGKREEDITVKPDFLEEATSSVASPNFIYSGQIEVELVPCSKVLPFVCEKPAMKRLVQPINICPEGWLGNPELPYCIRLVTEKKSYSLAEKLCQEQGGQLATVNDNASGRNVSVIQIAQEYYAFGDEGSGGDFFLSWSDVLWIQGNVLPELEGCLSVDFATERARFDRKSCEDDEFYALCTRSIIFAETPTISVDSVYLDKDALANVSPWSQHPISAMFNRFPLRNEVVFLKTPSGILNSSNFFQSTTRTQISYNVSTSFVTSQLPYYVNVTLPRFQSPAARKRRSLGYKKRVKRQGNSGRPFEGNEGLFSLDFSFVVSSCGYYSFGIHTLNPQRYVETNPVLMRYDESQMFIYIAKFQTGSWVIGQESDISETNVILRKLTNDFSYVSMLQEYLSGIFRELSPGGSFIDDPNAVENNFLYLKSVVDDVNYSPPEVILRVFVIPQPTPTATTDREQGYMPLVEEYIRQQINTQAAISDSLKILSTVACPTLMTVINSPILSNVTLPVTRIGQVGYSWERCYQGKGALVSAVCEGGYKTGAIWGKLNPNSGCQIFPELNTSLSSKDLKNLSETAITNDNVETVLENTANLTRPDVNLTEADVIYTAEILYNAWKFDGVIPIDLEDVYDVTNNIIQADTDAIYSAQRLNNAANRIIRSVDELTSAFKSSVYNESLRIVRTFVASTVQFQDGDESSGIVIGLELESSRQEQISDNSLVSVQKAADVNVQQTETAIYLSESLVKGSPTKLAFHIYTKTELFSVPKGRFKVNSNVAAARLFKKERPIVDLGKDKVTVIFDINEDSEDLVCGYWDYSANEDAGGWKTDGCIISRNVNNTKVICECDHLTNFAVLIDLNAGSVSDKHKTVLAVITKVGLSLSIIGLGLTILTFLVFKHLRNGRGQQVLINLSVAMLCSAVVFLVGMDRTENVTGCKIVAILLHYFILVSFSWMLVEGVLQYLRFVKVLGTYIPRFMMKTMIPAWGLPLLPVIIVLAIDHDLYFGGKGYCWLDLDAMLYAFIIPVAVILFANIVVFILILRNLCMRRNKMKTNQSERKMAFLHMNAAVSVFVILGLTWVFGFLAISGARIVFHYVFAFLNAFQGFFIFLLFTAREKQIRRAWTKLCCKESAYKANTSGTDSKPLKKTSDTPGSSSGTKSTSSTNDYTSSTNGNTSSTNDYTSSTNGHAASSNGNSSTAHFMNPQYSGQ